MTSSNILKGIFLAAFAGCCWGSMGVAAQYLFTSCNFTPEDLTPARLLGAGILLLIFAALVEKKAIFSALGNKRNLVDLVIYGVGVFLIQYTFFIAINLSNAGTAALMCGFGPLFIIFYFVLFKGQKPKFKELFCLCLAIIGISLIVTKGDFSSLDFSWQGAFWGLTSSAIGSFCTVQPRAVIDRIGVTPVVGWGMLIGGIVSCLFINPFATEGVWTAASTSCYIYIIVFGTVLAFWCYLKSTDYVIPSITAILGSFEPFSAVVLSVLILGTAFNNFELLGALAIVSNMIILSWPTKEDISRRL